MKVAVTEVTRYEYRCDGCGEDVTYVGYRPVELIADRGTADQSTKFCLEHVCKVCRHIIYLRLGQALKELREGSQ